MYCSHFPSWDITTKIHTNISAKIPWNLSPKPHEYLRKKLHLPIITQHSQPFHNIIHIYTEHLNHCKFSYITQKQLRVGNSHVFEPCSKSRTFALVRVLQINVLWVGVRIFLGKSSDMEVLHQQGCRNLCRISNPSPLKMGFPILSFLLDFSLHCRLGNGIRP